MDNSRVGSEWPKYPALLLSLLLATGMLLYVRRVLVPYQRADALAHDHPRGNLSDLYPRWLGARELLLHGRDPYSPAVTREIQVGYYGRSIDPSRPGDPRDQQAFAYPVYVVFLLAPMVYLPFQAIRTPFYGVLVLLLVASIVMWLRALRWKLKSSDIATLVLLVLGSLPVIQAIELQQLTLLVVLLLAASATLLIKGKFWLAGMCLALATIKPQLVLPLIAWLTLWAGSDWRRRKFLLYGFLLTTAILVAAGEYVLPGWMKQFFDAVLAYQQYTQEKSLLDALATAKWGRMLTAVVLLAATFIFWHLRHESEKSERFVFAFVLAMAVTATSVPTVSTYNQVLLLPGIFLLLGQQPPLWNQNPLTRLLYAVAAATIVWPWIAALGLAIASFFLPAARVQQAWALPFYTSIAIPLAVLGLLFQYSFQILGSERNSASIPEPHS